MGGMECVFCRIVRGQLLAERIYEDEDIIVVPDIHPSAPVHLLFISKIHGEELHKVEAGKFERMMDKVREKIAELNVPYRVAINGNGATQVADHLHIHLLGKISADKPV